MEISSCVLLLNMPEYSLPATIWFDWVIVASWINTEETDFINLFFRTNIQKRLQYIMRQIIDKVLNIIMPLTAYCASKNFCLFLVNLENKITFIDYQLLTCKSGKISQNIPKDEGDFSMSTGLWNCFNKLTPNFN